MKINNKFINKKTITIIILLVISIFLNISCQHIIQLPNIAKVPEEKISNTVIYYNKLLETSAEQKTLNILVVDGPCSKAAKDVASQFENLYGFKTNVIETDIGKIEELFFLEVNSQSVNTEKNKGVIDVLFYPSYMIGAYDRYLYDLNDYINKDNFDISDYLPGLFDLISKKGDNIFGLPIHTSIYSLICRNGTLPKGEKLSYVEYYNYLEELKNKALYTNVVLFDSSELSVLWSNRYWSLGGETTTEDWKVTINNETGYKSLEMLHQLLEYSSKDVFNKSYNDNFLDFISGNAAIFEGKPDFLINNDIKKSANYSDIFILPVPGGEYGNYSQIRSILAGISIFSGKKDMAWEWLKLYTNKENSIDFLDKYGLLSPKISVYENPNLNSKYIFLKDIFNLYYNINIKITYKIFYTKNIWESMLNKSLYDYLFGNKTSKDTIDEIINNWQSILDLYKPVGEKYKDITIKNY